MNIELSHDDATGALMATHASNGAILATARTPLALVAHLLDTVSKFADEQKERERAAAPDAHCGSPAIENFKAGLDRQQEQHRDRFRLGASVAQFMQPETLKLVLRDMDAASNEVSGEDNQQDFDDIVDFLGGVADAVQAGDLLND